MEELENKLVGTATVDTGMTPINIEDKYAAKGLMRVPKVRNKTPADVQITAEQLLAEAQAHREVADGPPKQMITDPDELNEYKMRTRTEFENAIRKQRQHIGTWLKYTKWEENLEEFDRARSVYERVLEVDYRNVASYLKYAEMEMRHKFINHARNVWERACRTLPRIDQFWFKYSYMEELLGNYSLARDIFTKWMTWRPGKNAWNAYMKFEERMEELDNVRMILNDYIDTFPQLESFVKAAKFEERMKNREGAREFYQRAIAELGEESLDETFFMKFAKFEIRMKELERARVLYKYALDNIPKDKSKNLYDQYLTFEKQHGEKDTIEDVVLTKRRVFYEEEIEKNKHNYDNWFDYIRLEESVGDIDKVRELYESAIALRPPIEEKMYWRRYIYLWLNYAIFEEQMAKDMERTHQVYLQALDIIPHKIFTFAKLWIMAAHFHIRRGDLPTARKVFGTALGKCPKEKIFKSYIELELELGNVERCRKIYDSFIRRFPSNSKGWTEYGELEQSLEENERVRGIYELALENPNLDMPENVWKAYIDFEIDNLDYMAVRGLYKRLFELTKHPKVWLSFARFEGSIQNVDRARAIYSKAYHHFKQAALDGGEELKEERLLILQEWIKMENLEILKDPPNSDLHKIAELEAKLPRKITKRRKIGGDEGEDYGWEEYYDYIFPDDLKAKAGMKLLDVAKKWKQKEELPKEENSPDSNNTNNNNIKTKKTEEENDNQEEEK